MPISLSLCPLQAPIEELSQEIRNTIVPLTNNAQFPVAPGESTSNSKAGHALELVSIVCLRFGLPGYPKLGPGPQPDRMDQQGTLPSLARFVLNLQGDPNLAMHAVQMVNQLGPPLDCLELGR